VSENDDLRRGIVIHLSQSRLRRPAARAHLAKNHRSGLAIVVLGLTLALTRPTIALGATYYVDKSIPTCSNNGPGTEVQPFCSILAAILKKAGPGTTLVVKAGTYREQVTVPASGASGNPLVITAQGTVTVDGADSYTSPAQWTPFAGNVWLAASVTWSPYQVFLDSGRLTSSSANPASLPADAFTYVAGVGLYVNAGGVNPADRAAMVGRRLNGFHLTGASWVTIEGFTVIRSDEKGIELEASADNVIVRNNTVSLCGSNGISLLSCSDGLIEGNRVFDNWHHGIELRVGCSANTIQDNVSYRNRGSGVATGIYLAGSSDNVLHRNRTYENQDSGIEIQSGSDNCVSTQNLSYRNGDHGFQHLFAHGTLNAGNVAWANHTDGFSIEGSSPTTTLYNCIAANNGVGISRFNLYVDASSSAGFTGDHNIFWNSTSQNPIKFNGVQYSTVAAFSTASGTDGQTLQTDPLFVNPVGDDFHLLAASPAIDSGLSGFQFWPGFDAQGYARVDDPGSVNLGAGPIDYADRGAFEYQTSTTGVGDGTSAEIALSEAFPNPAGPTVSFLISLPRAAKVEWGVFDLQGRRLGGGETWRPAGRSLVRWDTAAGTRATGGGIRFARVTVDGRTFARRFVTIR